MLSSSSSSSMIRRVVPFFTTRIRQNYRLLNSSVSALSQPQSQSQVEATDSVVMTENCVRRIKELQAGEHKEKMLRLSVEAGGCSGFQYEFSLDDKTNSDDRIFEHDGVKLVVDNVSFDFVKGATVDYVEELIRSAFQINCMMDATILFFRFCLSMRQELGQALAQAPKDLPF